MTKVLFSLLLVVLVHLVATSMAQAPPPDGPNPWPEFLTYPIENVSDPKIIEAGQFAISEYDKTTTYHLEFISVVNGTEVQYLQFPLEITWHLYVEARNCSQSGNTDIYVASVTSTYLRCTWFRPPPGCDYDELSFNGLSKPPAPAV